MKNQGTGKAAIFQAREIEKIRKSFNTKHRCIFEIALYTGERMGAICQLQVSDVYRDGVNSIPHDEITFKSLTRKARPNGMRETRQVLVHPDLKSFLESYKPPANGYLFTGGSTGCKKAAITSSTHISRRAVDKYWREQFIKFGLDHRGLSTHSTRRWLITQLVNNGVNLKTVQSITGHKSVNVLLGYVEGNEVVIKNALATISI
jgi:integrase/recombinase XerD